MKSCTRGSDISLAQISVAGSLPENRQKHMERDLYIPPFDPSTKSALSALIKRKPFHSLEGSSHLHFGTRLPTIVWASVYIPLYYYIWTSVKTCFNSKSNFKSPKKLPRRRTFHWSSPTSLWAFVCSLPTISKVFSLLPSLLRPWCVAEDVIFRWNWFHSPAERQIMKFEF